MAVKITHVFLWGSRATNRMEKALMGSPCDTLYFTDSVSKIEHWKVMLTTTPAASWYNYCTKIVSTL